MKSILTSACILITGLTLLLCGCSAVRQEKGEAVDFTLVAHDEIPEELLSLIEEKKAEPMELWYQDGTYFYIVRGYGTQSYAGYSIAVEELTLAEDEYVLRTRLIGPDTTEEVMEEPSFPYVVVKTQYPVSTVLFESV